MKLSIVFSAVVIAFFLSACSISLAGDVTPPPGYKLQQETQGEGEVVSEGFFPLIPPDPRNGEEIYQTNCSPCHGDKGLGDGPSSVQLPNPVPAIGTFAVAQAAIPADWYTVISQGNTQRFMPAFAEFTERQRWDVIAYVNSLSLQNQTVDEGLASFEANCVECHAEDGTGKEAINQLSGSVPDFTDQKTMAGKSNLELFQSITNGKSGMPAFSENLTDDQIWSITGYLRSLSYAPSDLVSVQPEKTQLEKTDVLTSTVSITSTTIVSPEVPALPSPLTSTLGSVTGLINNVTLNEPVEGLTVTLHGIDSMTSIAITATAQTDADGLYSFEKLEMLEGRIYLVTTEYEGIAYGSTIGTVEVSTTTFNLPIDVYETTQDISGLVVDRLHYFFEFLDTQAVRVVELYVISNPGNKSVAPLTPDLPVLTFSVPPEAENLQFEEGTLGDRFVQIEGGFGDTQPVRPGSGDYQVLYSYELPYANKLELSRPIKIPTTAVVVLVPEDGIKIHSDGIQDGGIRDVQGTQFHLYTGNNFNPGFNLILSITGKPSGTSSFSVEDSSSGIFIGLGALGIVLILVGLWLYRRSQSMHESLDEAERLPSAIVEDTPESIMDAILALDDLFKAGELPEDAYVQRRAELKEKLLKNSG